MNEADATVARALYLDAAIGVDALADRLVDAELENSVAIVSQLQEVAAYARCEVEISRHPESRAWAVC
jgi:hypothetical protein